MRINKISHVKVRKTKNGIPYISIKCIADDNEPVYWQGFANQKKSLIHGLAHFGYTGDLIETLRSGKLFNSLSVPECDIVIKDIVINPMHKTMRKVSKFVIKPKS